MFKTVIVVELAYFRKIRRQEDLIIYRVAHDAIRIGPGENA